ncbi:MAG: YHS domain-containing protein [Chloroflexi bacterium]|nr:MAG: YHS domain-containing protein [Chloroflexota bacterium]
MALELFEHILRLRRAGEPFALATVVRVEKPISATPGDKALITEAGALDGWVGGGCAQDIIVREARKAMHDGQARFLRLVGHGAAVSERSEGILEFPMTCHSGGTLDVFIEPVLPRPQLLLLGNSPVALALAKLAKVLDFEVSVFDPAATPEQFPGVDALTTDVDLRAVALRPSSFVVIATQGHDDEQALEAALRSDASYIAFVASRTKAASRIEYLRERGYSEEQLARIKAPAGLDIGAVTPEEIAASILAELIQVRRQSLPRGANLVQPDTITEAKDPVCGMMVAIATARFTSDFNGQRYYFCAAGCKATFEQDPLRYISP